MYNWRRFYKIGSTWVRSYSAAGYHPSSVSSSSTPKVLGERRSTSTVAFGLTGVIAGAALLATSKSSEASCESSFPHEIQELAMLLREKLREPREKLQRMKRQAPVLHLRTVSLPNRYHPREKTNSQLIDIQLEPHHCHLIPLFSHWMAIFEDADLKEKLPSRIRQLSEFLNNPEKMNLPFISADKKKSMTVVKYRTADGPRVGITIIKDNGFTVADVNALATGYIEGFCQELRPDMILPFQLLEESEYQQRVLRFLEDQNPLSRFMFDYYKDEEQHQSGFDVGEDNAPFRNVNRPGYNGSNNNSNSPIRSASPLSSGSSSSSDVIEKLRSLGVDVFDQSSNIKLSWDFLAGYDYVKKDIQDTVINAIKYPEVYDQIARKTRVVFESNRPKAVLLEGPPGTGKTLTARILASQCEIPLVVLKLETIVSKWYGDSEKKLAEIIDACNQLPNAIIFIDELDALAQSRDSENGIHEVSKRILSVLLQRLEGFHGKSNAILLCATNRKEDLDSALISRFDLMIKYDLPDKETRVALFQRYAKQFATNASNSTAINESYDRLSKISNGLSCRDIKEACEQAERICASRIVESKRKGVVIKDSEVPTLEDYINCLQMKLQGHGKSLPYSSI